MPLLFRESKLLAYISKVVTKSERVNSLERPSLCGHFHSFPSSLRRLQELPQLLLEDLQTLYTSRVRHADDRTPEIECIGDVGADAEEDKEDEVDGISKDCGQLALGDSVLMFVRLTGDNFIPTEC